MSVKKSKSVVRLKEAAQELFWKHGIKRVSVEEICSKASVSKMTCYRYFSNKEDIALNVLKDVFESAQSQYSEVMQASIPFREKIHKIVLLKHEHSLDFSEELFKDILNGQYSFISAYVEKIRQESEEQTKSFFENAIENGDLRKDLNLDYIIFLMHDMQQRLLNSQILEIFNHDINALSVEMTNQFFYGIMGSDE